MKILNDKQISQKIKRIALQIYERNATAKSLVFLGINKNGYAFAKLLMDTYVDISDRSAKLGSILLDAANPLASEVELKIEGVNLKGKHVIIVDDVANTGRTIFYAMKPLMNFLPKKVEAAVLVDRKHKSFPVAVDYVGLSLATTLDENIKVNIKKENSKAAFLV